MAPHEGGGLGFTEIWGGIVSLIVAALSWMFTSASKEKKDIQDKIRHIELNYVQKAAFHDAMSELKSDVKEGFREIKDILKLKEDK